MEPADSSLDNPSTATDPAAGLNAAVQAAPAAPDPTRTRAYAPAGEAIASQPAATVSGAGSPVFELPPEDLSVVESLSSEPTTEVVASSNASVPSTRSLSLFRFNRLAFLITATAIVVIALIGIGGLLLSNIHDKHARLAAAGVDNYSVGKLALGNIQPGQLQIGTASQLSVNGLLRVNNTLVLTPTGAPSSPTAGQFYFDRLTHVPYYYDGTQFVSLAPQGVTSLGGSSGAIGLGESLTIAGNQLSLSDAVLQQIANAGGSPNVTSIQGQTGDVTLSGGPGISINGTTISNSGVLTLAGTANQVSVSAATGNITLTLPQDIGTSSSPAFGGLTVAGTVSVNTLQQTVSGSNLNISAGSDNISFTAGGRTFIFPTSGPSSQTICTTGISCASGGGQAVLLQPGSAQTDTGSGPSVFLNNTGGGTLVELQSGGLDRFVVSNGGNVTAGTYNGQTISSAANFTGTIAIQGSNSLTLGTASANTGAILFKNSANTNTLTLQAGATASNLALTLPTADGLNGYCLMTNGSGALSFQSCTGGAGGGVTSLDGLSGILTINNSSGSGSAITINNAKADAATKGIATFNATNFTDNGTGTVNTVQNINTGAIPTFAGMTLNGGLTVTSGGIAVTGNSTIAGTLSSLTGLTSAGTITFSGLNSSGVVHTNGSGQLSTSAVALGIDTTGNYVANLGALTGLTTTGNSGAGSTPTLSVTYGSGANTAVQGNTALTCASGTGNLTGGGNAVTLGTGGACGNITIVNSPTFSGTVTIQGSSSLTLGTASSNTGSVAFKNSTNANTLTLQAGATGSNLTLTLPTADGSNGYCLQTNGSGVLSFNACTGGGAGGVTSLDGLAGVLTINNSSGAGSAITIDNAKADASTKGIATFNATNFSDNGAGVINTIQGISTAATPTFAGLTLNGALTVTAGGIAVTGNSTIAGTLSSLTGLTSSGTITFSGLNSAGVVHNSATGVLSTSAVALGTDTTGNYVANLGSLTGLTTTGNSGAGSTPTLSVTYGSGANTAVQGNTTLTCPSGTGNLTGTGNTITLGTGGTCNSLTVVNNPTFSGNLAVQGSGGVTIGVAGTTAGLLKLANGTNANLATLQSAALGQATAYNLIDPGVASVDICLSTGNCAGSGTGITGSGSNGKLAKFNSSNNIVDSTLSESGSTVTASGNVIIQGSSSLTLGTASSNTGSVAFKNSTNANTLTLQAGATGSNLTLTLPTADGSNGYCLQTNGSGVLSFNACTGGGAGGVTSLDGLAGVLTINNSSGAGSAITIDNAKADASTKGIATFNATNFSDNGAGVINTIQGISTAATPTFAGLTLSSALTVANGGTGTNTLTLNGILYGNGTSAIQATSAAANSILATNGSNVPSLTQTLPVAVQGNITATGVLASGSIASGFGTISTGNNITTTATVQGGIVNATSTLQLGGNDINAAGTLTNVAYLNAVSQTFTGVNTFSATGGNALAVTGAPTNSATSSLIQIGGPISGGNTSTNGGTYIGLNAPASGPGSAADLINLQANNSTKFKVDTNGNLSSLSNIQISGSSLTGGAYTKAYTVGTGGVNANDVVILANDGGNARVIDTATPRDIRVIGVVGSTVGSGSAIAVKLAGNAQVTADTGAVAIGDQLVTSSTSGQVTTDNNATTGIVGIATSTKSAGSSGLVSLVIHPVNGQTNPNIAGNLTVQGVGTSSFAGNLTVTGTINGATISGGTLSGGNVSGGTLTASAVNSLNVSGTAISGTGALTVDANGANTISIGSISTGDILLAGGSGSTGCTVTNATGALTCSSTLTVGANTSLSSTTLTIGGVAVCTSSGCSSAASSLAKNAVDTSTAAVTSLQGNLYTFTNSSSGVASGVLKLDNGTNTNSALTVTASGNPTSGQALIFASNTNASPIGNLIDLQSGSSPTSKFSVNAAGNLVAAGTVTATGILNANATGQTAISIADSGAQNSGITIGGDTNLYRSAANTLKTDDSLIVTGTETIQGNQLAFGAGPTLVATNSGSPNLQLLGGNFFVVGSSSTSAAYCSATNSDPNCRFQMRTDGLLQWGTGTSAVDTSLSRSGAGELTTNGNLVLQGGSLITNQTTASLFDTVATTLNIGGNVGAGGINLAGGSGSTGCTIDGSNGNLACSGNITGAATGTVGYWSRSGAVLQPATSGDSVTTSGNISTTGSGTITSAGLLTGSAGATISGSTINLNVNSNNITNINTGTSTGAVNIGNSAAGAITLQSASTINATAGAASTIQTTSGNLTLQAGSGTVSLGTSTNLTAAGAVTVAAGGSNQNLTLRSSGTGSIIVRPGTDSATAFQVQNAGGSATLFGVDTTNNVVSVLTNNTGETQPWNTNANSLTAARRKNTTVSANGYLYVLGGVNSGGSDQTTTMYAKLNAGGSTGIWTNSTALPAARSVGATTTVNGYVYYLGGSSTDTVMFAKLNTDGTLGSWKCQGTAGPCGTTPVNNNSITGGSTSVMYGGAFSANGYIYVVGTNGAGNTTAYYAKVYADGTTGSWSTTSSLSVTTLLEGVTVANGYAYLVGGENGSGGAQQSTFFSHINADGTLGTWKCQGVNSTVCGTTPFNNVALTIGVDATTAQAANGYLYVIGGVNSNVAQSTVYYAKFNSDGSIGNYSTSARTLPSGFFWGASALANGYLYTTGGDNGSGPISSVYYASLSRISAAGSLDLVGTSGQDLLGGNNQAGSLTAGNTNILGTLTVNDQASFAQGLFVGKDLEVGGSALFQNATDSANAFQVQNSSGNTVLSVDTSQTYAKVNIGGGTGLANSEIDFYNNGTETYNIGYDTAGLSGAGGGLFIYNNTQSNYVFGLDKANGAAIYKNVNNTTSGFQVQNAAGSNIFNVDTTNAKIGTINTTVASTNSNALTIKSGDASGATSNSGAVVIDSGSATGTAGNISIGTGAYAHNVTVGNTTGSSANTLQSGTAGTLVKGASSTTAFQVQNASSTSLFTVDTTNSVITLGTQNGGATSTWTTANSSGFAARANAATTTGNGYVYEIGGQTVTNNASNTYFGTVQYAKINADGTLGNWTTTTALGVNRFASSAVYVNGYIYVMGGSTTNSRTNVVNTVYYGKVNTDGTVSAWNTTATLGTASFFAASSYSNGYIYYVGGVDSSNNSLGTVQYSKINADGSLATWSTTTATTSGTTNGERDSHGVVISGGTIYVFGGERNGTANSKADVLYNTVNTNGTLSASWTDQGATNALPTTIEGFSYAATDGYIYVYGGFSGGGAQSTKFYYAPIPAAGGQLGAWTDATATNPLTAARGDATGFTANGYIYNIAGTDTNTTSQTTIYATSTGRVRVSGSLDLVGLTGQSLADGTSNSGTLTAGNTNIMGALQVQGAANFSQSVAISGNLTVGGDVAIKSTTNSTTAFQIQNSTGTNLFAVDTSGSKLSVTGTNTTFATLILTDSHLRFTQTTAPTAAIIPAGLGTAGNGATCTVAGSDSGGEISMTAASTGTGNGGWCTITFKTAYTVTPRIIFTGANAGGGNSDPYVLNQSTTQFTIANTNNAVVNTTYIYDYIVFQN